MDWSRTSLLLTNSVHKGRELAQSARATRHGRAPSKSGHGKIVPVKIEKLFMLCWAENSARSARAKRHNRATSIWKKSNKTDVNFGPLVQPGTGPKTENYQKHGPKTGRTKEDLSGPVRSRIENWTALGIATPTFSTHGPPSPLAYGILNIFFY